MFDMVVFESFGGERGCEGQKSEGAHSYKLEEGGGGGGIVKYLELPVQAGMSHSLGMGKCGYRLTQLSDSTRAENKS